MAGSRTDQTVPNEAALRHLARIIAAAIRAEEGKAVDPEEDVLSICHPEFGAALPSLEGLACCDLRKEKGDGSVPL